MRQKKQRTHTGDLLEMRLVCCVDVSSPSPSSSPPFPPSLSFSPCFLRLPTLPSCSTLLSLLFRHLTSSFLSSVSFFLSHSLVYLSLTHLSPALSLTPSPLILSHLPAPLARLLSHTRALTYARCLRQNTAFAGMHRPAAADPA